jgi:phytoene desaturase
MYLGVSPFDALATYSLLQYTELADGVWFPMGGMYSVIQNMVSIAENMGVEFITNQPVEKIIIKDQKAVGIVLEDGRTFNADIILANADLPYVYRKLLPDPKHSQKLQKLKYTCSTIMFYWGVDKVFPQLAHHNVFLSDDYVGSFDAIFNHHTLPEDPSFYVHAPARTDSSAAPINQDTLFVLVPVGHLVEGKSMDWDLLVRKSRQAVFDRLNKKGVQQLENHLKFEIVYTPVDWEHDYNLEKGATFGLSHNFMQVGYLRPANRHRLWKNLYFVGSSTHPGGGVPIALLSAKLVTERIMKDYGPLL